PPPPAAGAAAAAARPPPPGALLILYGEIRQQLAQRGTCWKSGTSVVPTWVGSSSVLDPVLGRQA
ncbi:hypothetical protein, partial [Nocardia abscessus]|uniref:hypothetical protein n=1 Tax=Nocardia abscessus TaxID=120957 RepID=UPI0024582A8E